MALPPSSLAHGKLTGKVVIFEHDADIPEIDEQEEQEMDERVRRFFSLYSLIFPVFSAFMSKFLQII